MMRRASAAGLQHGDKLWAGPDGLDPGAGSGFAQQHMTVSWFRSREPHLRKSKMARAQSRTSVRLVAFIANLCAYFGVGRSTVQVPLLLWSTESFPSLASPAAGRIVPSSQLAAYLTSGFHSGSHTVLLFLQDKLSKDDFTVYGGVYGNKQDGAFLNLEAAMQSSTSSLVLPALEWSVASDAPALLQETLGVSPVLVDPDTLSDLQLNPTDSNLLYFNLPYCTGLHESCEQVLRNNDQIIGKVLSIMKAKNILYTAIYTGLQPSRVIPETSMSEQRLGRSLLQAAPPGVKDPLIFNVSNTPCIMLWAQNLNVRFATDWIDLATETPTLDGSLCNSTNSLLVLNYPRGIVLRECPLLLNTSHVLKRYCVVIDIIPSFAMSQKFFPVSARNWFSLDSVLLKSNNETVSFDGSRGIYAPAEYSFHCMSVNSFRDALLIRGQTSLNTSNWMLNFIDFQIQGFGLANGTNFSYASDCAGFFTAGIWMGLVITLLMLWILTYGLSMITMVNTMDRFDDPKGPSISVPQTE
ncbi:V-type proton ATPase subunit S1 [Merluccius polli]|uniref:V-type proton ATPase subunit S1 n=1 Tax=Merluccius polli TaxID=89951 RepID=A0AA47MUM2_MERPO|nr:V-type proton ATPase subunit S1 [Merluccius polli]